MGIKSNALKKTVEFQFMSKFYNLKLKYEKSPRNLILESMNLSTISYLSAKQCWLRFWKKIHKSPISKFTSLGEI